MNQKKDTFMPYKKARYEFFVISIGFPVTIQKLKCRHSLPLYTYERAFSRFFFLEIRKNRPPRIVFSPGKQIRKKHCRTTRNDRKLSSVTSSSTKNRDVTIRKTRERRAKRGPHFHGASRRVV